MKSAFAFLIVAAAATSLSLAQVLKEVKPRSYWGAREVMEGNEDQYKKNTKIEFITIHHTASRATHPDWDEKKLLQFVQSYHQTGKSPQTGEPNHYRDIAYHFIVSESGNIFEGRALDRAPASASHYLSREELKGAKYVNGKAVPAGPVSKDVPGHTRGHITVSFRHGLTATGEKDETIFSNEVMDKAAMLIAELLVANDLTPAAVRAHREMTAGATSCPGDAIYRWLRGPLMRPDGEGDGMKRIKSEYERLKSQGGK